MARKKTEDVTMETVEEVKTEEAKTDETKSEEAKTEEEPKKKKTTTRKAKKTYNWKDFDDVEKEKSCGDCEALIVRARLHFLDEILGTVTRDEAVYREYIASKAPDAQTVEDEVAMLGVEEVMDKTITSFRRDPRTNEPIILGYMVEGFFKNAAKALRDTSTSFTSEVTNYKSKISNEVKVFPKMIKFNGVVYNEEGKLRICERPLRASTPLGERIALAASEAVNAGTTCEIKIHCLNPEMYLMVLELMDYGRYNGIGQWHNSGKGSFLWERLDKEGNCIGGNFEEFKEYLDFALEYEEFRQAEEAVRLEVKRAKAEAAAEAEKKKKAATATKKKTA